MHPLSKIDAEYRRRLEGLINYDDLTGLLTLRPFYRALDHELTRADRLSLPLGLLMIDLDHFKQLNDTHGYKAGNYVTMEVGRLLCHGLRHDTAARYGGDEFIAYLSNANRVMAVATAEWLRDAIASHPFEHNGVRHRVTVSIGVGWFPEDRHDLDGLVRRADERVNRAKEGGGNRVCAVG